MNLALRITARLSDIPADAWDNLVKKSHGGVLHPALRHAFLSAMEDSADVGERTGWVPRHLCLHDADDTLIAAAPAYLKYHSYGEYVFDWAWADAYQRNQLEYYPKLLTAIPFTPVFGNRLLAQNDESRAFLLQAIMQTLKQASTDSSIFGERISSWHGLFLDEATLPDMGKTELLKRDTVQFHWRNTGAQPYDSFDAFLATLTQKKRKNILAERRKVAQAGIVVRPVTGHEISAEQLDFFYRCYANTYREHRSLPYLSPDFFKAVISRMPQQLVFFFAERLTSADAQPVAASLCLQSDTTLYGRYWGAMEHVPCLHFETAYYAPLQWAIGQKLQCFEGGAQGEHKMSRGFMPVPASSRHWLAHPAFADAIERYLQRESAGMANYLNELESHPPFRHVSDRVTE